MLFNFSYTLDSGSIISGQLQGNLQSDNDTVVISSILNPFFNGASAPELPILVSLSELLPAPFYFSPKVSFSGLTVSFCASNNSNCSGEGFFFDSIGEIFGFPAVSTGFSYGQVFEVYSPNSWTLSQTQVISEFSSSLALFIFVLVGLIIRWAK